MPDGASLPLLNIDRVLLPGERAAVPIRSSAELSGVEPGSEVALRFSGASVVSVGVVAEVESVQALGGEVVMVSVLSRARVEAIEITAPGVAAVRVADAIGPVSESEMAATKTALRRYLAALSEYGRPVDLYPEIPDDPIPGSYAVASLLEISAGERHVLLEVDNASGRFGLLETILDRERRLLEATMGAKGN
jgi:hypothetical protein